MEQASDFEDLFAENEQGKIQENEVEMTTSIAVIDEELEDELFGDDLEDRQEAEEEKQIQTAALDLLTNANVNELSLRQIRQQLAEKYSIDTEKHKKLIRNIVETYVSEHQNPEDQLGEGEEAGEKNDDDDDDDEVRDTVGKRDTEVKKRKSVFSKPALLSATLAEFIGKKFAPRGEVVKAIWDYIKANNLQNPKDRRVILFDEKLQTIFKKKSSHFMKMSTLLAKEMKSVDQVAPSSLEEDDDEGSEEGESGDEEEEEEEQGSRRSSRKRPSSVVYKKGKPVTGSAKKQKAEPKKVAKKKKEEEEDEEEEDDDEEEEEEKPKKSSRSKSKAGTKRLTPEFAEFLKLDPLTPRKNVVKELYAYIKEQNLQNPKDRREILLDETLQSFFKVKKVTYFSINKYLNKVFYEE